MGVANRNGFLFMISAITSFNAYESVVLVFPDEKPVIYRELNNNMYKASCFYIARLLSEVPGALFMPLGFTLLTYFSIDLSTEHWYTFFVFLGTLILVYFCSNSFGTIVAILIKNKKLILLSIPYIHLTLLLFSGFFINRH